MARHSPPWTAAFDTLAAARALEAAGMERRQAEAVAGVEARLEARMEQQEARAEARIARAEARIWLALAGLLVAQTDAGTAMLALMLP